MSFPGISGVTDIKDRRDDIYYSGWFNVFFPLINPSGDGYGGGLKQKGDAPKFRGNGYCVAYSDSQDYVKCGLVGGADGPELETLPGGISSAPVLYKDVSDGNEYNMKFVAGFFGCTQDPKTLEVTPNVGWLIGEE